MKQEDGAGRVRAAGRAGAGATTVVTTRDQVSYRIRRLDAAGRGTCPLRCYSIRRIAAATSARPA